MSSKLPPDQIIHEDSGPPISEPKNRLPGEPEDDFDDSMIEEPKDETFDAQAKADGMSSEERQRALLRLREAFPQKSEAEILEMVDGDISKPRRP